MRKEALTIIRRMISNFDLIFVAKDNYTKCALHSVIGKIGLACELELITLEEADELIDKLFQKYEKIDKF